MVMNKTLEDMAEHLHLTLESQAEAFVSTRLSTPVSDTLDSQSMNIDTLSNSFNNNTSNIQYFVTKWLQDRVNYHVYQIKAKYLYQIAYPSKPSTTPTVQVQPTPAQPTPKPFGLRNIFMPWTS